MGVTEVNPSEGERFDRNRHEAVGHVPTTDSSLHNRVAKTERPGYSDRGRVVAVPQVLVYQVDGA